jgi:hypothetical protein
MKKILLFIFLCAQTAAFAQYLELNLSIINLKANVHPVITLINNSTGTREVTKPRYNKFPIHLAMENHYKIVIEAEGYAKRSYEIDLLCGPYTNRGVFDLEIPMAVPTTTGKVKEVKAGFIRYQEKEKALIYKMAEGKNKTGSIALTKS